MGYLCQWNVLGCSYVSHEMKNPVLSPQMLWVLSRITNNSLQEGAVTPWRLHIGTFKPIS